MKESLNSKLQSDRHEKISLKEQIQKFMFEYVKNSDP